MVRESIMASSDKTHALWVSYVGWAEAEEGWPATNSQNLVIFRITAPPTYVRTPKSDRAYDLLRSYEAAREKCERLCVRVPQVKVFATKPGNLSSTPGFHMVEGENSSEVEKKILEDGTWRWCSFERQVQRRAVGKMQRYIPKP